MSTTAIAPPLHAMPVLAALRVRALAEARAGAGAAASNSVPAARAPREVGAQFAALLDARPVAASPVTATVAAVTTTISNLPARADPSIPQDSARPADASNPETSPSIPQGERVQVHTAARQHDGLRATLRPVRATSAAADIERLIDELAEFVLRQPGARVHSWSVTLWLRAAVLRDTCLTMNGEPGRIAISFATNNAASLRRLHAGHEALQARLRQRIPVATLDVIIGAARPCPEASPT